MIQTKLLKRILSYALAASLLITPALVQEVATAQNYGEVVFYEDFGTPAVEDGTPIIGIEQDGDGNEVILEGFNGWSVFDGRTTERYVLQQAKFTVETEPGTTNRVGSLVRPTNVDIVADMGVYMMQKSFIKPAKGIVEISFRANPVNLAARYMPITIHDSGGITVANTQVYFANGYVTFGSTRVGYFGENPEGAQVERNRWYNLSYVIDTNKKTFSLFEDGEFLGSVDVGDITDVSEIKIGTHRTDAAQKGCQILIDDIVATEVGEMAVNKSTPQNGEVYAEVYGGATVEFTNQVDPSSIEGALVLLNGSAEDIDSVTLNPENGKELIITYTKQLEFDREYALAVSGISDTHQQRMKGTETIKFKTRKRQLLILDPIFTSGGSDVTDIGLVGGEVKTKISVVNETSTTKQIIILATLFEGDEMKALQASSASIPPAFAQEDVYTTLNVAQAQNHSIRIFIWDNLKDKTPIAKTWVFDEYGISETQISQTFSANNVQVWVDHESGRVHINGEAAEGAAITASVIRPGFESVQIDEQNASQAIEFVGQEIADDNRFGFEFIVSPEYRENKKTYTVSVGGGATAEFKLYGTEDTEDVILALNSATADKIGKMLSKINPSPASGDIILNDVLQLDLSIYYALKEPSNVNAALSSMSFDNVDDARQAFYEETARQEAEEARLQQLIDEVNAALWGNLEQVFKDNDTELVLDWDGAYKALNSDQKITLYKKLASDYVFNTINEIRNAFSQTAQNIKNEKPKSNKPSSSGGSGGSTIITETKPKVTPEPMPTPTPGEVFFTDIADVQWAIQSIEELSRRNVINGIGHGLFAPHEDVTREQFVKMLILAFGLESEAAVSSFTDVESEAWYSPYISMAVDRGIISGMGDGLFGVGRKISRAEMAAAAGRAAKAAGITLPVNHEPQAFTDAEHIPEYAKEYVMSMQRAGIMSGMGDGTFAFAQGATRAQAAKVIFGLVSLAGN